MKRLISILLLGVLLCGMVLPASAAVIDPVAPQYKKSFRLLPRFMSMKKPASHTAMQTALPKVM